jgi:hypothetical protein
MDARYSPSYYKPKQPPVGVTYPDNIYPKKLRGYYSDIDVLIRSDGSINVSILLFARCFHNMKDYLVQMFGIETFEQLVNDDRLYNGELDHVVSYASFESFIPKEFQQEALFRLIESPDSFAEWVDRHDGYNGKSDWRV